MSCTFEELLKFLPTERDRKLFKDVEKIRRKIMCPYIIEEQIRFVRRRIRSFKGEPWKLALLAGYQQSLHYSFMQRLFYALQEAYRSENAKEEVGALKQLTKRIPAFNDSHPVWKLFNAGSSLNVLSIFTRQITKTPATT